MCQDFFGDFIDIDQLTQIVSVIKLTNYFLQINHMVLQRKEENDGFVFY